MIGFVRNMIAKLSVAGESLRFLRQRELWGLIPKVAVMKRSLIAFITIFGIVAIVLAASCACTPLATALLPEAPATASAPAAASEAPPAATLTATFAAITRGGSSSGDYYVSPEGSDSNPGTEAQPFKTIERARQAVRATIASGMSSDIMVLIRGGKYFLSSTLSFDEQDSGRDGYEVIYQNYPDEEPIIIGGQEISGWGYYSGDIYRAHVGNWEFYTLMENGVFSTMARHPNSGWRNMVETQEGCHDCPREAWFTYASGDFPNFDYSDAQVYVITGGPGNTEWWAMTLPILNINWSARKITVKKWGTWRPLREDDRYRIRGSLDFLDEPGEYYLDQSSDYLYYWPRSSPIQDQEIVAPKVKRIVEVIGDSVEGNHVENIRFSGLTFVLGDQAETIQLDDPTPVWAGLLYLENVDNITVECCTIRNAGHNGIMLHKSAQNNTIYGNEIGNIGEYGIRLNGLEEDDIRHVNKNNVISNNYLYNGYSEYADGTQHWVGLGSYKAAIGLLQSGDNTIVHNEVEHWPYMGINLVGARYTTIAAEIAECPACWDYLHNRNNYIAFNSISQVMEDANDGGGLYSFGGGKNNVFDNNLVHNIESGSLRQQDATGIYLDNDSSYWTVEDNIVYNISGVGQAMALKGKYNTVENNIFADNPAGTPRWGGHTHINSVPEGFRYTIKKNIFYREEGDRIYYWYKWRANQMSEIDYNLLYHPGGGYYVQLGRTGPELTLAEWRTEDNGAYDRNSIVANPLFVDSANRDYTLLPGSPALALGFENIDTSNIGRVDDPCRPDGTPTPTPGPSPTPTPTATPTPTPTPTATPTTTPTPRTVFSYFFPLLSAVLDIDGDLSEWAAFPAVVLDVSTADWVDPREVPDPADASAILRSGWDDEFIYFAVEIRDDVLVADSAEIWRDDSIELGIDGLYDHIGWNADDHQFTLNLDGRVTDRGDPTGAVIAVTSTLDGGWALEVAIAAEGLGAGPLTVGKTTGFTFGLHDDDDGGDWESYLVWEGSSTNDSSAEYGALVLSRVTPTPTPTPPTVTSYFLPAVPDVNGDLSEWGTLPAVVLDAGTADHVDPREVPDSADGSAVLRSGWDDGFLYFAIEVRDDVLVADSADIWRDDGIELGIDGLYDHIGWNADDHQFTLNLDGRVTDRGDPTGAVIAVTSTLDGGWALEVAIAAEGLGAGPLTVGKAMGFTFGLHDDDDGGDWESYLIWEGDSTNDSSIEYGRLLLTLAPASFGGFAWNDTDADRVQGGVENGISGVTLVLYDVVNGLVASAVTDANGFYRFEGLSSGIYTVMATKPPGYRFTTAATVVRSVESGDQDMTVSFGFVATTAVTLVSFGAEVQPEGVVISWRTLGEQGITGFHLRRALSQLGPWMDVTDGPIRAQGMSGGMAAYRVVDDEAERGLTYYRLVTTPDGQEFGPISVDVGA